MEFYLTIGVGDKLNLIQLWLMSEKQICKSIKFHTVIYELCKYQKSRTEFHF